MASGQFGGGDGSSASPYLIEDIQDLNAIRYYPSSNFKLTQSINMGVYPYNEGKGWLPIPNFYGSLDGDGHKIFNLYIKRQGENNIGLFSQLLVNNNYTMQIKNLQIINANIVGYANVGILAGSINVTTTIAQTEYLVTDCEFLGSVNGTSSLGGMIGYLYWNNSLTHIQNFTNNVFVEAHLSINASSNNYGALVGYTAHNIKVNSTVTNSDIDTSVNGTATTLSPSNWGIFASNVTMTFANAYYNKTKWTYGSGANGVDFATISYTTLGTLDRVRNNNQNVWSFMKDTRVPRLQQFFVNKYYLKYNGGYYIYDGNSFVHKFDKILTREQLFENAMSSLDSIPFTAWLQLKEQVSSFEIIAVTEENNMATYNESTLNMTEKTIASHTDDTKKFFTTKISLLNDEGKLDIKNTIVNMKKGIITG